MEVALSASTLVCAVACRSADRVALESFLEALATPANAAVIVFVADESLDGATAPALRASGARTRLLATDDAIDPGWVHVVPAGMVLALRRKRLCLVPARAGNDSRVLFDTFFQVVSLCHGQNTVAVLLASHGSDGALGLESVSAAGGFGMVVTPSSGSPVAATPGAPGTEDPPESIAGRIADVSGTPAELATGLQAWLRQMAGQAEPAVELRMPDIRAVCERVRSVTGHDFAHYKQSTLSRRIVRRCKVLRCRDIEAYLQVLDGDAEEARRLMRDLLIGVTGFFRDAAVFDGLQSRALAQLIRADTTEPVRVWVAGCGTGQEAYSIAMLAIETAQACGSVQDIRVYATDLDERALAVARRGTYPRGALEAVDGERQQRFFEPVGRRLRATRELRQHIVFSPHNLIADPPFSRMDLISCRNLLIYLGPHLQTKLMSVFHYALNPGGYLLLGSSESVSGHGDLFRVVDASLRLAQRKASAVRGAPSPAGRPGGVPGASWQPLDSAPDVDVGAIAQRIVLDEFAPPYAVVNGDGHIEYLSSGVHRFLQPVEGQFINSIIRMTRSGLRVGLRKAWNRAQKIRRKVTHEGLTVDDDGERRRIRLVVQPMPELGADQGTFMVVFHDLGVVPGADDGVALSSADSDRLVEQLEEELLRTREELERSVQDLEAANEELKSSNEELLSMNEELQSANEELAVSKEDVQHALTAVSVANTDLSNLFRSTDVATLFLDAKGCIRHFTPPVASLYNITYADIGRPLEHFTHVQPGLPALPAVLPAQDPSATHELEFTLANGLTYLRRLSSYCDEEGQVTGSVVMYVDMTEQKRSRDQLAAALAELEAIYQHTPVGLALIDTDMRYLRINEELAAMNARSPADHIGRTVREVVPDLADAAADLMREVVTTREAVGPFEITGRTPRDPGVDHHWLETWLPIFDNQQRMTAVSVVALDITERKRGERAIVESEARLRRVLDGVLAFIGTLDMQGTLTEANHPAIAAAGLSRSDVIGKPFWDCFWWSHSADAQARLRAAFEEACAGKVVRYDAEIRVADDARITIDFQLSPVHGADGRIIEIIPSGVDITSRKEAESRRELLLGELNHRVKNSLATIQAMASQTLRNTTDPDLFRETFVGRLRAIAAAHDILTTAPDGRARIGELVAGQVAPYAAVDGIRVSASGPEVELSGPVAHALGMVLHELATNATKYGALSDKGGKVAINWRLLNGAERQDVHVEWTETGGPPVTAPEHKGFGTRLIETSVSYSLGGKARLSFEPDGLRASIRIPTQADYD